MKEKMHDKLELCLQEYSWQSSDSGDSLIVWPAAFLHLPSDDDACKNRPPEQTH
jgi:hypothetical protein